MGEFGTRVTESKQLGLPNTPTADDNEICIDLIGKFEQNPRRRTIEKNDAGPIDRCNSRARTIDTNHDSAHGSISRSANDNDRTRAPSQSSPGERP